MCLQEDDKNEYGSNKLSITEKRRSPASLASSEWTELLNKWQLDDEIGRRRIQHARAIQLIFYDDDDEGCWPDDDDDHQQQHWSTIFDESSSEENRTNSRETTYNWSYCRLEGLSGEEASEI